MTEAQALQVLTAAGVADPAGDMRRLMAHASGDTDAFASFITRRAAREPVSHITAQRPFWTSVFEVSSDVLDPRPDTETLVEAAIDVPWKTVLDLGTGSGCILLSLLRDRDGSTGLGVDISEVALDVARRNRARLELDDRARLTRSDWFDAVDGPFDLIVSNPPYIAADIYETLQPEVREFEPKIALTPGGDGLDAYRIITAQAGDYLTQGGRLMVEIGYDQAAAVCALFKQAGFRDINVVQDLNGKARVICAILR